MTITIADRIVCQPDIRQKRGSSPALQNAGSNAKPQEPPPAFGRRRCSGAFRSACRALLWLALPALMVLAAPPAQAATRTWSGGAPLLNAWSIAANWSGGVAPVAGDNLVFPLGAARMTNRNDFPAGTAFGSITFQNLPVNPRWRASNRAPASWTDTVSGVIHQRGKRSVPTTPPERRRFATGRAWGRRRGVIGSVVTEPRIDQGHNQKSRVR